MFWNWPLCWIKFWYPTVIHIKSIYCFQSYWKLCAKWILTFYLSITTAREKITSHRPPQMIYLIQNTPRKRSIVYVSFLKKRTFLNSRSNPAACGGEDGVSKRSIFPEMSRYSISVRRRCVTPFLQLQLLPHKRRWNLTFVVTGGILSACFWFPDTKDTKRPLQMRPPSLRTYLRLRKVGKPFSHFSKLASDQLITFSPFWENVLILMFAVSHINTYTPLPERLF